jgi:hypothetical protein
MKNGLSLATTTDDFKAYKIAPRINHIARTELNRLLPSFAQT